MTANNGLLTDFQGIVETLFVGMAQINHNASAVHFMYDLLTKSTDAMVCLAASCRVADIVVAIMTEGHVNNATLSEMVEVFHLSIQRMSFLDAKLVALLA
jgi:hypothetical protein